MDKNKLNTVLASVRNNEKVNYNDLRSAVKAVGASVPKNPNKDDLLKALGSVGTRGPGRPKARPEDLVGYKVKIGLRYPTEDGTLVNNMRDGATFATKEDGQKVVDDLVKAGEVRVWGGTVRAKFLPRYSSKG